MTEETEDILTFKLSEMDIKFSNDNDPKGALPVRCWGRGWKRPDIKDLDFSGFFQKFDKENFLAYKMGSSKSSRLFTSKPMSDGIMENIKSQCENVLGNQISDQEIINVLSKMNVGGDDEDKNPSVSSEQNRSSYVNCHFTEKKHSVSSKLNSKRSENILNNCTKPQEGFKIKKKRKKYASKHNNTSEVCMSSNYGSESSLSLKNADDEYDNLDEKTDTSSYKERDSKNYSISVCEELREKNCIILENIPSQVNEDELHEFLNGFGIIKNMKIIKNETNAYANIRMANEDDCNNIIECLNESYAFGTASLPIKVYFQ
ncbi:uncharacterized protein LOC111638569 isoform X1 [Centruroides sculpturatus]|uniref:uncharacterized protein LOC111638569 isoform X1 n=1 Tax=Centruroides sculpturatus TaxID=218467 RepID=UPI000C6C9B0B|nr:uncharacterized protein LOC111638569 isoform X1 [Centruroides sculpturatus]XP_023240063.1 uncharacterized protein LOC111638569 isoform X2 [Centruroides sculpturatus]XP_023240064.1 uncharacterized protein LOC111638569 isoform X1 [Centruroides sculpturatus]XP_023240065.1 uncharacterized protein LOC111638569 isoform X1 [Centruroides sculpturatus]